MNINKKEAVMKVIERTMENLRKNNMAAFYADTKENVCPIVESLLKDGETFRIGDIKIHCFLVPGHTWGHMVYLIDDKYLFTGDTIWFGADGGYSFISALADALKSLGILEAKLKKIGIKPLFITGHTGWTGDFEFAFAHRDKLCSPFKKKVHDPAAPYDAYDESDDTESAAKNGFLKSVDCSGFSR